MFARKLNPTLGTLGLLLLALFCSTANADCSDDHIRALSEKGKSVRAIARQCGMSEEDVSAVVDSGGDDDPPDDPPATHRRHGGGSGGLPSGATITACGCWGYVANGAGQPNPSCSSGYEHAVGCGGMCPAGGSPWARVCQ
jgi:hypothetical protein